MVEERAVITYLLPLQVLGDLASTEGPESRGKRPARGDIHSYYLLHGVWYAGMPVQPMVVGQVIHQHTNKQFLDNNQKSSSFS